MSTNRTEPFRHYRQGVKRRSDTGAQPTPPSSNAAEDASEPPAKRSVSESSIVTSPVDFERFVQANFREHLEGTADLFASEDDATERSSPSTVSAEAGVAAHSAATPNPGAYTKSSRACKGKRYLEFINTVRVATVAPKKPATVRSSLHVRSPTADSTTAHFEMFDHLYASQSKPATLAAAAAAVAAAEGKSTKSSRSPVSDSADFDLDSKIKALNALSLDEYLSRKRDTKKKKKITAKPKITAAKSSVTNNSSILLTAAKRQKFAGAASNHRAPQQQQLQQSQFVIQPYESPQHPSSPVANPMVDLMRAQSALERREQMRQATAAATISTAVGSQKRKARKESITRRDIAGSASSLPSSPTEPVASPDLLILAQVAAIITSN